MERLNDIWSEAYRVAAVVVKGVCKLGLAGVVAVLRRLAERMDDQAHVRIVAADRAPTRAESGG